MNEIVIKYRRFVIKVRNRKSFKCYDIWRDNVYYCFELSLKYAIDFINNYHLIKATKKYYGEQE